MLAHREGQASGAAAQPPNRSCGRVVSCLEASNLIPIRLPPAALLGAAIRHVLADPSSLRPALALLLPTLGLQLAFPTYLRTRLAPEMWTVGAGAVLLIWLTQAVTPSVCALVHARRTGTRSLSPAQLARLSIALGTSVTTGLALAVLPGLWIQARYAFAPLQSAQDRGDSPLVMMRRSGVETRPAFLALLLMAVSALVGSALGQGAVAALAEAVGTVTPVEHVSGRTIFELHYLPHALTSILAYAWSAATLTVYAAGVSVACDGVRGKSLSTRLDPHPRQVRVGLASVPALAAATTVLLALAAVVYKVRLHL
jgi:hypothetical protein